MPLSSQPVTAIVGESLEDSGQQRLMRAAAAEFAEHGYAGASIAGIARQAGVSKSTVFHHFDSKEDLYLAVIRDAAGKFGQTLESVLVDPAQPGATLAAFQQAHLQHVRKHRQVATLVLGELQSGDEQRALALVRDVLWPNFSRLVRYLDDAAAAGLIRADVDPHTVALTLLSANVMFFQTETVLGRLPGFERAGDPAAHAEAVADLIFRGLQAKGEPQ
jgi:TetR/AcrR family transcriptional regulator